MQDLQRALAGSDWPRAEKLLLHATRDPRAPGAIFYNLAKVMMKQGRTDEMGPSLKESLKRDPGYPPAWFELGRWHMARREFREARDAFLRAGALMPRDADCRRFAGRACLALGDWNGAFSAFGELRRIVPDDPEALIKGYTAAAELRSPAASELRAAIAARPDLRGELIGAIIGASAGRLALRP